MKHLEHISIILIPLFSEERSPMDFSNAPCLLSIVIPAFNEELAIAAIIERCLQAKSEIKSKSGVTDVEVIVVNDGSTDRTAEIVRQYNNVKAISLEHNQGYGAAIQTGWRHAAGELLGFMDADGTCDPRDFAEMCRLAITQRADVVLGSRMGRNSQMPPIRRLGNLGYAIILGFLCGRHITDIASGMRIVRRDSLQDLLPLPDGMHFTPSMSARALLNNLRILEMPIKYEKRTGTSKLHVISDGMRFCRTIVDGMLCYRPESIFLTCLMACLLGMTLLAAGPTEFYLRNHSLEEWMIYRFTACTLLGSVSHLLLLATALANLMARLSRRRRDAVPFLPAMIASILGGRVLLLVIASLLGTSLVLLWPGLIEWGTTGHVHLHWSRLLAGSFCVFLAMQTGVFAVLMQVVFIWCGETRSITSEHMVHAVNDTSEAGTMMKQDGNI